MKTDKQVNHENNVVIKLNDQYRKSLRGPVLLTPGVQALETPDLAALLHKVRTFDVFTEDNDPHGEHDFGAVEHNGTKYFWKFDYYDPETEYHADPADPGTHRVLTIMRADEY